MSTDGYENCEPGTFYGFSDNENNEYHPGDIFHLKWGTIGDPEYTPLNISFGRPGGSLIDEIVCEYFPLPYSFFHEIKTC